MKSEKRWWEADTELSVHIIIPAPCIWLFTFNRWLHLKHHWKLTELLAEQELPNRLLHLIEAGIDLALLSDNTHQGEAWDGDEEGNIGEKRVAQLLNDDEINMEYKAAFRQQTIIGWEYIFTGKFAKG